MNDSSTAAESLGIGEGWTVWVIGDSVEERSLLDPMPEGAFTVEEPQDGLDAAVLVTGDARRLAAQLDEVLPRLGSVPSVWVCFPGDDLPVEDVADVVNEYGWWVSEPIPVDETWSATRLHVG